MRRPNQEAEFWHVFNRGVRRLGIFCNDAEYLEFLRILKYATEESDSEICAYCLMPNHFHLILKGCPVQITAFMRRLETLYSKFHNEQHGLSGANFEGPYQRYPQRTPFLLGQRLAYVLLNPVAAGLVSDPAEYRWSCYRSYSGLPGSILEVDPTVILKATGRSFQKIMDDYVPPLHHSQEPPHLEVCLDQVLWLRHQAARRGPVGPFSPDDLTIFWARAAGIRPDAIGTALKTSVRSISNRLYYLKRCLSQDPALAGRVTPD